MLFTFRRREAPWEVVDSKGVEAVPMYYEDEGESNLARVHVPEACSQFSLADLDIVVIGETDTRGTYVFEERKERNIADLRHVIVFARQQLLKEVTRRGYNVLLSERFVSTSMSVFRC